MTVRYFPYDCIPKGDEINFSSSKHRLCKYANYRARFYDYVHVKSSNMNFVPYGAPKTLTLISRITWKEESKSRGTATSNAAGIIICQLKMGSYIKML